MVTFPGFESAIKKTYDYNQDHVFKFWNDLNDSEKKILLNELSSIDFEQLKKIYSQKEISLRTDFKPAPYIALPSTDKELKLYDQARKAGIEHIRNNKVCAFIVAGGQGSRLGYSGPKGKFPVGPVSNKTLFQIHGEKILKYSKKYNASIPWLVMTSDVNHTETAEYFEEMKYFGLNKKDVFIFSQEMIPSLDINGKLILSSKCTLFKNPDGHGGSLTILKKSGALDEIRKRRIETISYFQVDNPLVKIIDPVFIGFHVLNGAEISSKSLAKSSAAEKVGVFIEYPDKRLGVIEYSDLPKEKAELTDENGKLKFISGSIAIHLFSTEFIEKITSGGEIALPFHTAKKKISSYTADGNKEIDGLKFEKFVFDALPLTDKNNIFETNREDEFAPVKNATGEDSVHSSQMLMNNLYRKWLISKGVKIPDTVQVIELTADTAVEAEDIDSGLVLPDKKEVFI